MGAVVMGTVDDLAFAAPRGAWGLDPEVTFLNHGSFGACPRVVLEEQGRLRAELERQPVRFFLRGYQERLDAARAAVAGFVDAEVEGFAFVRNASAGVNAVLRSIAWAAGDEIVVTDHGYGAVNLTVEYVARQHGARVVVVRLPFEGIDEDAIVDGIVGAVTSRTRLAVLDHITSPTGLVFPIERIVKALDARGVDTLVDGAHAPGMVALSVRSVGAAYYTANLHKWTCAPKGAGFLAVRGDRVDGIHPAVISHGHGFSTALAGRSRFHLEFDWTGTDDPTPWFCAPLSIATVGAMHPEGWAGWRRRNRAVTLAGRALVAEAVGARVPCGASLIGWLAAVRLPRAGYGPPESFLYSSPLNVALLEEGIEVPVVPWPAHPERSVRFSVAPYTTLDEVRRLADALGRLVGGGR